MKRGIIILSFLSVLFFSCCCCAEDNKPVFMGVENDIPYAYEENGELKGIDYDVFNQIIRRAGIAATVKLFPFKRLIAYLKEGTADGTFQIFYYKEREEFLIYSDIPIHYSTYRVFIKKGSGFVFNTVSDLYGKRMGKVRGFFFSEEFEQAVKDKKITLEETDDTESNLRKLAAGRIDGFVSNSQMARFYIKKLGFGENIAELPTPLVADKPLYLALSKKGNLIADKPGLMKKINAAMKSLKEEGVLKAINDKYLK